MARKQGRLDQLCRSVGVTIVAGKSHPGVCETRARATLYSILDTHEQDHLVFTLKCIVDTGNKKNRHELSAEVIGAVSDVLFAHVPLDQFNSEILDIFSQIDLGAIRERAIKSENKRDLIAGAITEIFNQRRAS